MWPATPAGYTVKRRCSLVACSAALARISGASTSVATPSRNVGTPAMSTSIALIVGVKATCQGSIVAYDQCTRSPRAAGNSAQPRSSHDQAASGDALDVMVAVLDVRELELGQHVGPDAVGAERHGVAEAGGIGVADGVVHVRSRVVHDRAAQPVISWQVHPVDQQPVVASQVA